MIRQETLERRPRLMAGYGLDGDLIEILFRLPDHMIMRMAIALANSNINTVEDLKPVVDGHVEIYGISKIGVRDLKNALNGVQPW